MTLVAGLTVALAVAGTTVLFSMTKAWILDPLPFSQPDALVDLRNLDVTTGNHGAIAPADFLDWQRAARAFDDLAAHRLDDVRLTDGGAAERVRGARVTPNFFRALGARAATGRVLGAADGEPGQPACRPAGTRAMA